MTAIQLHNYLRQADSTQYCPGGFRMVFMALGNSKQAIGGNWLWDKVIVAWQIYQMLGDLATLVNRLK